MEDVTVTQLNELRADLIARVRTAGIPDDVEKLASALKSTTEAATAKETLGIQRRTISLEALKSWATILVPGVSVLGLCATIWYQGQQLAVTRVAGEDTQWINTLAALTAPDAGPRSGYVSFERLKPFLRAGRYVGDARDISSLLLGHISSREIFDDLLVASFPRPTAEDLPRIVRIERALNESYNSTDIILKRIDAAKSDPDKSKVARELEALTSMRYNQPGLPTASMEEDARHAQGEIAAEVVSAGAILADLLRGRIDSNPLALNDIWLPHIDLHNANLQKVDFSGTEMDQVDLSGADLRGTRIHDGLDTVKWWLAKYLDKDVIEYAMKSNYPYAFNANGGNADESKSYSDPPVTRDEYVTNVRRLCKQVGCNVSDLDVLFGPVTPVSK